MRLMATLSLLVVHTAVCTTAVDPDPTTKNKRNVQPIIVQSLSDKASFAQTYL